MLSLVDHNPATLAAEFERLGFNPAHARTAMLNFYARDGRPPFNHLRFGKAIARRMDEDRAATCSHIQTKHVSHDGTIKFLVGFRNGGSAEAVLMDTARDGIAAGCLSSQIGCAMRCDFCASTKKGLQRDLTAGEIVEQFLNVRAAARETGRRLRTIVFMGMGEPLMNFDNVTTAIHRIAHCSMGSQGYRQITVSTVGITPAIDRLADIDLNVHLALSLHAPDDETRSRIVPMNRKYPIASIMEATKRYVRLVGREPNIEYCMLEGVNDSLDQAYMLADLMRGFRAHLNLIPYNSIGTSLSGVTYRRPSDERIVEFLKILRDNGVRTHIRTTRGDDVSAACGQLRIMSSVA